LDISFIYWFGVFTAEEVDGIADKVSENTITVAVGTHLEAFLNMSLRSASNID
jgi:antirestriction protein ArdC